VDADAQVMTLGRHLSQWGGLPDWHGSSFLSELERSGLRGQGGAWFPLAAKWRSLRTTRLRGPVVVANGAEGEPASGKDRLLIHLVPHLVLDGAAVAARTLGASQVYVHVHADAVSTMRQAIDERQRYGLDPVVPEVVVAPERYLAGQESAVVNTIGGGKPATPSFTGIRPVRDLGVAGRPTLVQNVESLAHVALIARFGAEWFRSAGTPDSPGTSLLTVTGRWREPRIVEARLGTPLGHLLGIGPADAGQVQGILLGGYGGGWLPTTQALAMPLTEEEARRNGSSLGAGVVALLPASVCSLIEVSRVVRYMDGQKAGQCGPCVNGLDGLARSLELLAHQPGSLRGGLNAILALCDLVDRRGACGHPDGVARFVRSGLRVFADHAQLHLQRGPCHLDSPPFLPVPANPASPSGRIGPVRQARTIRPDGSVRPSTGVRSNPGRSSRTGRSSRDR
jgi:NADH:ubiquinone oxidoreductase subunit F (NADH-binding)